MAYIVMAYVVMAYVVMAYIVMVYIVMVYSYGLDQTVTPGLSAIGSTKFIATFSRTLDTGPSHAPSPSYISLARDRSTNASLAHGFFLNTHGFSSL